MLTVGEVLIGLGCTRSTALSVVEVLQAVDEVDSSAELVWSEIQRRLLISTLVH